MVFKAFKIAVLSAALSACCIIPLILFVHPTPKASSLSQQVMPEWAYMLKPEWEVNSYRLFVMLSIVFFTAGLWIFRKQLLSATDVQPSAVPKAKPWSWWEAIIFLSVGAFLLPSSINAILGTITDFCYHIDSFFMSPGLAAIKGLTLNIAVNSEYSNVIPVVYAKALSIFHGFNYQNVVAAMIISALCYWCAYYVFLRQWIGSPKAACFAVILGIGFQMFHPGVYPINWQFPSTTVLRFLWDLAFWLSLWSFIRHGHRRYLYLAAMFVGVSLAWTIDVGVYLGLTFMAFIGFEKLFLKSRIEWKDIIASGCILTAAYLSLLFLSGGASIFTQTFWQNSFEFAGLFLEGWGALPVTYALEQKQYIAFILGLAVPIFYVVILLSTAFLVYRRVYARTDIIAALLSIYGLGLYHYFIFRSGPTSYAVMCLPAVAILCWLLVKLNFKYWNMFIAAAVVLLMANPLVRQYPGWWNMKAAASKLSWFDQVNLDKDAALIKSMTSVNEPVPVLGSFETLLLLKADRPPFFYYFPIFQSDDMKMLQFRGTYLHTKQRLADTINDLETRKPTYVFVEKKLFFNQIPSWYFEQHTSLMVLMMYLKQRYAPDAQGEFFLALKRI